MFQAFPNNFEKSQARLEYSVYFNEHFRNKRMHNNLFLLPFHKKAATSGHKKQE